MVIGIMVIIMVKGMISTFITTEFPWVLWAVIILATTHLSPFNKWKVMVVVMIVVMMGLVIALVVVLVVALVMALVMMTTAMVVVVVILVITTVIKAKFPGSNYLGHDTSLSV